MLKILPFFLLSFFSFSAYAETTAYFTPSTLCEDGIISRLDNAENSVDIAVYAFNNKKIGNALRQAKKRGVKIRFLTDKVQAAGNASDALTLYDEGFDLRVHTKHRIEHNKFAVYDKKSVSTGSFNWTTPASEKNSENCVFIDEQKDIADAFSQRFDELWQANTKEKSDTAIKKIKKRRAEKAQKKKKP